MSSIRINSICPCDLTGETGFYIYLNSTVFQNAPNPINIDSLDIKNNTTGTTYSSATIPAVLTITGPVLVGVYWQIKVVFTDIVGVMPEGHYNITIKMDYTDSAGVAQNNKTFYLSKFSLCASEAQLQKDLADIVLSEKCIPENCQNLKDIFWEAYTLFRAMKIVDSCAVDIAWNNTYLKLIKLLAILKKEKCLNC